MAKILVTSAAIRKFDLVDSGGDLNVVENALITVTDKNSGAILNLFDQNDPESPITNPFNANADGQFAFYVEAGEIKIFAQTIVDSTLLTGSAFVSAGQGGSGTVLRLSDYVLDGATAAEVGDALEKISAEIQDGYTVDLSGDWKWGEKSLRVEDKKGVTIRGGLFTKTSGEAGAEFLIWVTRCDGTKVNSLTLDGGEAGVAFGQQGLYLPRSVNTSVSNCTFLNIGDAPIRYAEKTTANVDTMTDGLVITGCVFHNCTQVTSNNTGAYNVVIDGNVFKNSSIKVTQTTDQITGATIISNNNFEGIDKPITAQGFYRMHVKNNVMKDCVQLVEFYTNQNTTQSEYIAFKDVFIENNTVYTNSGSRMIYIEARPRIDGVTPLDCDGVISIKNNNFYRADGVAPTQNTIGMFAYNSGVYLAKHFDVSGNNFYGRHFGILNIGGDNAVTILNGGSIKIDDNWAELEVENRCLRLTYSCSKVYPDFELSICGNKLRTKDFLAIGYSNKTIISNYKICNNEIEIINFDTSFTFDQISTFQGGNPLSTNVVINGNTFKTLDNTNKGGAIVNMNTPLATETRRYTHTFSNNIFIANNIGNTFPLYCSFNAGGRRFDSVSMFGNQIHSDGAANPRSDNVDFEIYAGSFIIDGNSGVYVTYSNYRSKTNNGFSLFQIYSTGERRQIGRELLDFGAASGNIYIQQAAPSNNYSLRISHTTSSASSSYILTQATNFFAPRVDTWDDTNKTFVSTGNVMIGYELNWFE